MAIDVPSWVNTIGWIAILFITLALYRDARVRLRDFGAKLAPIGPLQAQVKGQGEQIGNLTRAVALLVPPDARPTAAHGKAPDKPASKPVAGLSRPFQPSPAQEQPPAAPPAGVAAARRYDGRPRRASTPARRSR